MGAASVEYKELRFVIEDELTQVYVHCEAYGDAPIGVQGWHHKTFPKTKPVTEIMVEMFQNGGPVLWPQNAPN